jgi:twitching motility protein PilT
VHINDLLKIAAERRASDLHIKVGSHPVIRVDGELVPLVELKRLMQEDTIAMAFSIMSSRQKEKFKNNYEIDIAYSVPGLGRFRCNIFQQRGTVGMVLRVIPVKILSIRELMLPVVLEKIAEERRGLILCTGTTGSGKSTTLAAMIDYINTHRTEHIMTVEDPIEFLHKHKNCIVNQREVGADTHGFTAALKHVLRQDPDVILVGEMRDLETISTAITAAETGHLVFATLHTQDAPQTIDRIIDVFPPHQQQQVRVQLSTTLQGVVTQQLIPTIDGQGRAVACEVLVTTPAIRNLIREGKVHQIYSSMQAGGRYGMQTMDMSLAQHVKAGTISQQMAYERCHDSEELQRLLGSTGSLGGPSAATLDGGQDMNGGVALGGGMVMGGM